MNVMVGLIHLEIILLLVIRKIIYEHLLENNRSRTHMLVYMNQIDVKQFLDDLNLFYHNRRKVIHGSNSYIINFSPKFRKSFTEDTNYTR